MCGLYPPELEESSGFRMLAASNYLNDGSSWMQLPLDITQLLQFLFSHVAHLVLLWVDSSMSFLPEYVVRNVALIFDFRVWHFQKTEQFKIQVVAKLKGESVYHLRFASNSFVLCLHIQVFCCLGKCLVGFWKGYFNQKRCRRREIILIRMKEYRFCTTLFSILNKCCRKAQLPFVFRDILKNETLFDLDCF